MKENKKDFLLVPAIIILGKVISFLFNALMAKYYGAGKISDAFIMAHSIPTILFEGIATAIISCYIPIYSSIKYKAEDKLGEYNSNMTTISALLGFAVTIVYFVFRGGINRIYASGFDSESLALLNHYSAILVWSIPFIGIYSIFRAFLQSNGKKAVSSLGQPINYSVLIIAIVVFYPNADSLAWATLFGNIAIFVLLLASAAKKGYKYNFVLSFKEDYVKTMLLMIFPIFFSTLASDIASIVDKSFASRYTEGIITSMTYGYQLSFSMQGIVSTSVLIVLYPTFADRAAKKDFDGLNDIFYRCVELITWIIAPVVVGGIIVAKPVIQILFGHGNFDADDVSVTAVVFAVYMLGVLPMCIKHVGDRMCYALQKTNYAMLTTFATVGVNIILDYLLSIKFSYIGLAAATGIAITAGTAVSFILIRRANTAFSLLKTMQAAVIPTVIALLMGLALSAVNTGMDKALQRDIGTLPRLLTDIILGAAIYTALGFIICKKRIVSLLRCIIK